MRSPIGRRCYRPREMRTLKTYSASTGNIFGGQPENYGDNLMTPLLRELFDIDPEYVPMSEAELIGIGSSLTAITAERAGIL